MIFDCTSFTELTDS